jgi:general stress protein CsbA
MKEDDIYAEISSIRSMMERSTKFISLSGLSGVLAGIYALVGAGVAYQMLYGIGTHRHLQQYSAQATRNLFLVAFIVLVVALGTGIMLTMRKAKSKGLNVWNKSSQGMLISGGIPLFTGGLFVLILIWHGHFGIIAPACLLFYGLALTAAGNYTYGDVKWLGVIEVLLGLLAAIYQGYGLWFWAMGFGVMHIIYGAVMYFKYDRESNVNKF